MGLNSATMGFGIAAGVGVVIGILFVFLLILTGLFYIGCAVAGLRPPNFIRAVGFVALAYFAALIAMLVLTTLIGLGLGLTGVRLGAWGGFFLQVVILILTFGVEVMIAGAIYNWGFQIDEGPAVAMVQFGIPLGLALLFGLVAAVRTSQVESIIAQRAEERQAARSNNYFPSSQSASASAPVSTDAGPNTGIVAKIGFGIFAIACFASLIGSVMLLVEGFRESAGWGLAMLFVPLASLIFVITYWHQAKQCVYIQLASLAFIGVGFAMGAGEYRRVGDSNVAFNNPNEDPSTNPNSGLGASSSSGGYTPYGSTTPNTDPGYGSDPTDLGSNAGMDNVSDPGGYTPYGSADSGPDPAMDLSDPAAELSDPSADFPDPSTEFPDPLAELPDPAMDSADPANDPGAGEPLFNEPGGASGEYIPYGAAGASSAPKTASQPLFDDPSGVPAASNPFENPGDVTTDPGIGNPGFDDPAGTTPFVPQRRPIPPTLAGKAEWALEAGRVRDGVLYLCAAGLVDDNAEAWRKIGWNTKLERPLFTLRWGLGVEGVAAGAGRNRDTDDPLADPDAGLGADPNLDPLDGEPLDPSQATAAAAASDPVVNQIHVVTNGVGTNLLANLQARAARIGVGSAKDLVVPLGLSPRRGDLLAQAQREGLDVVVLIKLSTKLVGLARRPEITMVLQLFDARTGKQMWRSKSLSSTKYTAQKERGVDLADELLRSLGAYASQNLTLSARPTINTEDAKKRVESLIDDRSVSPLRALAEVKYFRRNDLLTDTATLEYFRLIAGGDQRGALLISGTPAERSEVIQAWLPKLE